MHRILPALIFVAAIVAAFGCGDGISNEEIAAKFEDRATMICADEADGSRWAVTHYHSGIFRVRPLTK